MYYFKGDLVKLKSGAIAEIVDEWGVARQWYKVRVQMDKQLLYIMQSDIDSLHKRFKPTKGRK